MAASSSSAPTGLSMRLRRPGASLNASHPRRLRQAARGPSLVAAAAIAPGDRRRFIGADGDFGSLDRLFFHRADARVSSRPTPWWATKGSLTQAKELVADQKSGFLARGIGNRPWLK